MTVLSFSRDQQAFLRNQTKCNGLHSARSVQFPGFQRVIETRVKAWENVKPSPKGDFKFLVLCPKRFSFRL